MQKKWVKSFLPFPTITGKRLYRGEWLKQDDRLKQAACGEIFTKTKAACSRANWKKMPNYARFFYKSGQL